MSAAQENESLMQLIEKLNEADANWQRAGAAWEAAHNAPGGTSSQQALEAGAALDEAIKAHHKISSELAFKVRALFKAGYRLISKGSE